jgi:hypothetical protein
MSAVLNNSKAAATPQPWLYAERALLAYVWRQMRSTRIRAMLTWLVIVLVLGCFSLAVARPMGADFDVSAVEWHVREWCSSISLLLIIAAWFGAQVTLLRACNQAVFSLAPGTSAAGRNIAVATTLLLAACCTAGFAIIASQSPSLNEFSTAQMTKFYAWFFIGVLFFLVAILLSITQPKVLVLPMIFVIGVLFGIKLPGNLPAFMVWLTENNVAALFVMLITIPIVLWITASAAYGRLSRFKAIPGSKQEMVLKATSLSDPSIWRMPQMWGKWFSVARCYSWMFAAAQRRVARNLDSALREFLPFSLAPSAHWVSYIWVNFGMLLVIVVIFKVMSIPVSNENTNLPFLVVFSYSAFASSLSMLPVVICSTRAEQRLLWLMPHTVTLRSGNGVLMQLIRTILLRSFLLGLGTFVTLAWTFSVSLEKAFMALLITAGTTFIVVGRNARDYAHIPATVGYGWLVLEPMLYAIALLLFADLNNGKPALQWAVLGGSVALAACWMAWRLRVLSNYEPAFPVGRLVTY